MEMRLKSPRDEKLMPRFQAHRNQFLIFSFWV